MKISEEKLLDVRLGILIVSTIIGLILAFVIIPDLKPRQSDYMRTCIIGIILCCVINIKQVYHLWIFKKTIENDRK